MLQEGCMKATQCRKRVDFRVVIFASILLVLPITVCAAGGQAESSSSGLGKYLAGRGVIIPRDDIRVNSYIASIDYGYPSPDEPIGIYLYSGHRQISVDGQVEIIHIGIQAKRQSFYELPPMNLAFVIDKSGSMNAEEKMNWVKDAFDIFIRQVRSDDFVSLVAFNHEAEVLFPSTQMNSIERRMAFTEVVHMVDAEGGTNLHDGLELGYKQILINYRENYTNRVLFLTDGVGNSEGIMRLAADYREKSINVSTIGVGEDFDSRLMSELARTGGGSSRFISDREEMEETFGSELDRMVVAVARDMEMELVLPESAEVLGTWGYEHKIDGNRVSYSLPTMHHGDYETIVARIRFPESEVGRREIARFSLNRKNLVGDFIEGEPNVLYGQFVDGIEPIAGYSNAMAMRSGTMMRFALRLQEIADVYYAASGITDRVNTLRDAIWFARDENSEIEYEDITSDEIAVLEKQNDAALRNSLNLSVDMLRELRNVSVRLDMQGFSDEIGILEKYVEILGGDLDMPETEYAKLIEIDEMTTSVTHAVEDAVRHLADELFLELHSTGRDGTIAIADFVDQEGDGSALTADIGEAIFEKLTELTSMHIVEKEDIATAMAELQASTADLKDTTTAIALGRRLSTDFVLTGTIADTDNSTLAFGRIIDVESEEIVSAAQIIIMKDEDGDDES